MTKKLYLFLLCTLLAVMLAFGISSLTDTDPTMTESGPVKKPETTMDSMLRGTFTSQWETYYADTFPGRKTMIALNRTLNNFYYFSPMQETMLVIDHMGGAEQGGERLPEIELMPDDEIVEEEEPISWEDTSDGLTEEQPQGGDVQRAGNVVIIGTRALEVPYLSVPAVQSYGAAVSRIAAALGPDVRTFSVITPNGAQFYTPESMHTGATDQRVLIQTAYDFMTGVIPVDVYGRIERHTDEYLFFRTDHHWTQLGAYYAYQAFCASAGFEADPIETYESGTYDTFVGSMYNFTSGYPQSQILLNNPDSLTYYFPKHSTTVRYYYSTYLTGGVEIPLISTNVQSTNKYLCYISGDTPVCIIESTAPGGVCMVIKNSYGNAFVPFLADQYSKIIAIDPREFYGEGKPYIDLAAFAAEQGVNDLIVIDYPFMVGNGTYANILNNLIK